LLKDVDDYLHRLPLPPSSKEEQAKLIERWQQEGDVDARNQLVREVMAYVIREVGNRPWLDIDDGVQNAAIEVMTAADKFDTSTGYSFLTYARYRIAKTYNQTRGAQHVLNLPAHAVTRITKRRKIEQDYVSKGVSSVRAAQIAYEQSTPNQRSTDYRVVDVEKTDLSTGPDVPSDHTPRPMLKHIQEKRVRTALQFAYGLIGMRGWRQVELARVMGLTRQRVEQILSQALNDIRRGVSR
jgi:RNA polymerase sigma factor (sigma-70 family)